MAEILNTTGVVSAKAKIATSVIKLGMTIEDQTAGLAKADLENILVKIIDAGNGSNPVIHSVDLWTLLEESAETVGVFMLAANKLTGSVDLVVDEMPFNAREINFLEVQLSGLVATQTVKLYAIDGWGNDGALRNLQLKSIVGSAMNDISLMGVKRMIIPISKIDSVTLDYPALGNLKAKSVTYTEEELEILQLEDPGIVYLKGKSATPQYLVENNWILACNNAVRAKVQPKAAAGDFNILLDK